MALASASSSQASASSSSGNSQRAFSIESTVSRCPEPFAQRKVIADAGPASMRASKKMSGGFLTSMFWHLLPPFPPAPLELQSRGTLLSYREADVGHLASELAGLFEPRPEHPDRGQETRNLF